MAEMPLTPKGYCDTSGAGVILTLGLAGAEMPLTPKGYCDSELPMGYFNFRIAPGRNAPNAERLL